MKDKSSRIKEIQDKIIEGLKISSKNMIENKKKINGKIVVYADGKIQTINAIDIK
jgi:hypothetical protein